MLEHGQQMHGGHAHATLGESLRPDAPELPQSCPNLGHDRVYGRDVASSDALRRYGDIGSRTGGVGSHSLHVNHHTKVKDHVNPND